MKELNRRSPIWHAVIWIVIYVVLVMIGDWLSEVMGRENSTTSVLVLALGIVLIAYVHANEWREYYGVRGFRRTDAARSLLFLPLLALALLQFIKPVRTMDFLAVLLIVLLMVGVGLVEELIFGGFLLRAILKRGTLTRAILISGVTFGLGHIVNLARGCTGPDQLVQIVAAIAIGITLALLFAVTGSIMPGVVFHVLSNISGSVTACDLATESLLAGIIVIVCVAHSVYLSMVLRKHGPARLLREEGAVA